MSPVRTHTSQGGRGLPETCPTHGIMPCKACHPFAPIHPRATALDPSIFSMDNGLGQYTQSCLEKASTYAPSKCFVTVRVIGGSLREAATCSGSWRPAYPPSQVLRPCRLCRLGIQPLPLAFCFGWAPQTTVRRLGDFRTIQKPQSLHPPVLVVTRRFYT